MFELFRYWIQFQLLENHPPSVGNQLMFATDTEEPAEAMRQAGEYLQSKYGKYKFTGFSGPDAKILVRMPGTVLK